MFSKGRKEKANKRSKTSQMRKTNTQMLSILIYLPGLGLLALVDDVGVLLVPAALIVVAAVGLPIS